MLARSSTDTPTAENLLISRIEPEYVFRHYFRPNMGPTLHIASTASTGSFFFSLLFAFDALTSILNWMFVAHAKSISHVARIDRHIDVRLHASMLVLELVLCWPKVQNENNLKWIIIIISWVCEKRKCRLFHSHYKLRFGCVRRHAHDSFVQRSKDGRGKNNAVVCIVCFCASVSFHFDFLHLRAHITPSTKTIWPINYLMKEFHY